MIKKLFVLCMLSTWIYSNALVAQEIHLLCRYENSSSDSLALTLNLNNSTATSIPLVGQYVGIISTYNILRTSDEYILQESTDDSAIYYWSLDRKNLEAVWRVKINGKLAIKKEATCRLFQVENKI